MNEAIKILEKISQQNWVNFNQGQIDLQKRKDREQESIATIIKYDSSTGKYRVKDRNGNYHLATAICNSAALCIGNTCSLSITANGIPIIDGMPY
jgi:hypothetical protein